MQLARSRSAVLSLLMSLAACGGGGGSTAPVTSDSSGSPAPAPAPAPAQTPAASPSASPAPSPSPSPSPSPAPSPAPAPAAATVQRIDLAESTVRVNTVETGNQFSPDIARLRAGGSVIAWASGSSLSAVAPFDVCFQVYDAADARIGAPACVAGAHRVAAGPRVVARSDGGFTILWSEGQDSSDASAWHWQDYSATGAAQGSIQGGPLPVALSATPLAGGGYVALSRPAGQDFISFQLYAADGTPGATAAVGDTNGLPATAVGLAGGGFAVAWYQNSDPSFLSIMTRAFSADGTPLGPPVAVAPNTLGPVDCGRNGTTATCEAFQNLRGLAATDDGGYIVVWQDGTGLGTPGNTFARRFLANGSPASAVVGRLAGAQTGSVAMTGPDELTLLLTQDDSSGTGVSALRASVAALRP